MLATHVYLQMLGVFRLPQGDQPVAGLNRARLQHWPARLALHRAARLSRQLLAFLFAPDPLAWQILTNLHTLLTRLRHVVSDPDRFIAATIQKAEGRPEVPSILDAGQAAAAQAGGARPVATATHTGELLLDFRNVDT